jgi:hypothetical protein
MTKRIYDERCSVVDSEMGYAGIGMELRSEISKIIVRMVKEGYDLADIQTFIIREAVNSVTEIRTHYDHVIKS